MSELLNAEYWDDFDDLELYIIQEIGFSHKELAKKNNLYAKFKQFDSSVFSEIFNHNYLSTNEMYQVWIMDTKSNKPVGLSIAVVFEDDKIIKSKIQEFQEDEGQIIGQIHCYIKPEYRGMGLMKKIIPKLENFLYKKCPLDKLPCIVMEDRAYALAKYTRNCVVFSSPQVLLEKNISLYDDFLNGNNRYLPYQQFDSEPQEDLKKNNKDVIVNLNIKVNEELSPKMKIR